MNGVHDLGGAHGFGPVAAEQSEPVFHEPWEGRVYAMMRAVRAQGIFGTDEMRAGIERMEPWHYLQSSYYEHWLASLELNLIEKGVLSQAEIEARVAVLGRTPEPAAPGQKMPGLTARILTNDLNIAMPQYGVSCPSLFDEGDAVVARNVHPKGHTRLPRYVRGKRGSIARVHGLAPLPDAIVAGLGSQSQPLYSVRFTGEELWGQSAEQGEDLYLDLWESYLERAPSALK